MKKSILCFCLAALALLSGCKRKSETGTATENDTHMTEETMHESEIKEYITSDADPSQLKVEDLNTFSKAITSENSHLIPYALLATQVVSGTNYLYLCKDGSSWRYVTVYRDLKNNYSISANEDINLAEAYKMPYTEKELDSIKKETDIAGGWTANSKLTAISISKNADEAFGKLKSIKPLVVLSPSNQAMMVILCNKNGTFLYTVYDAENNNINGYYKFSY